MRILIVDDSAHFLEAARRVFEHDGVTVVGTASTSAEALRLAAELRPDVNLVDVDLGEESGIELAERLATVAPVVLISAYPESELVDLLADSAAVGYLPKSELSALAVSDLLSRARGGTS